MYTYIYVYIHTGGKASKRPAWCPATSTSGGRGSDGQPRGKFNLASFLNCLNSGSRVNSRVN